MAQIIDITGKIKNEEKFIAYNGKTYKVDDRKNTMIKVYSILDAAGNANLTMIDEVLALVLGKNAVKDFAELSYEDSLVPFFAALACIQGKPYEEIEASFRESK